MQKLISQFLEIEIIIKPTWIIRSTTESEITSSDTDVLKEDGEV